jgi:PAS domain S-box-containing protein
MASMHKNKPDWRSLIEELEKREQQLTEAAEMARVGSWEYDVTTQKIYWSRQVYAIFDLPETVEPSKELVLSSYPESYREMMLEARERALINKETYDIEIPVRKRSGQLIWVHIIGKPVIDKDGSVTGLRGTIQDIDEQKKKQLELQESSSIISAQNKRLLNFAHIVSHNLRSHAGNLKLLLELIKTAGDPVEKEVYMSSLHKLSDSLTQTITHLHDVVKLQSETRISKTPLSFEEVFDETVSVLAPTIAETNTIIDADFAACPVIEYTPAYLDSIMLNLLSNAIKYRQPGRQPEIIVRTFVQDGRKCLRIQDNGLGIDLHKYKSKLFGMYKTFHQNKDARGIGLFITRTQVEALGGYIEVESEPGKGTTFTVFF